jgi:hypothetical protein
MKVFIESLLKTLTKETIIIWKIRKHGNKNRLNSNTLNLQILLNFKL